MPTVKHRYVAMRWLADCAELLTECLIATRQ